MATDFLNLTAVFVTFAPHPRYPEAHHHLNTIYSDVLPTLNNLFTDNAKRHVLADPGNITEIRRQISDQLIRPLATDTIDPDASIKPIIDRAAIHVVVPPNYLRRVNKNALEQAMKIAIDTGKNMIEIRVGISHMNIDHSTTVNFLDWAKFNNAPFPGAPVVPFTPMTPASITTAVAAAFAPTGGAGRLGAPITGAAYLFDHRLLPDHGGDLSVRARYTHNRDGGMIKGNVVSQPFPVDPAAGPGAVAHYYHTDGPERIILADGTLFINQNTDEKGLLRSPVNCIDDTFTGIRAWYPHLMRHLHDHGFYCHPFWCFRRDHGGEWGFTMGDTGADDLPRNLSAPVRGMSQSVFKLLTSKYMFPSDSRLPALVAACHGNGYKALKDIIFSSHPSYHDQPSVMLGKYPMQRTLTLHQYHTLFIDFLRLRAFITSVATSLDDDLEFDLFIANATHSVYLNRVSRDERRVVANAHKFRGSQLLETLTKYLNAPDSPLKTAKAAPVTPKASRPSHVPAPKVVAARVAQISVDDPASDLGSPVPGNEVPHYQYLAGLHALRAKPTAAATSPCIVCGGDHRFAECDVLKNNAFLRDHYIRYCQQLRREASARRVAFNQSSSVPSTEGVAAIESIPAAEPEEQPVSFVSSQSMDMDDDDDYDEASDFQRGRA